MITVLVHRDGRTREAASLDPVWLAPEAPEQIWVDLEAPGEAERRVLSDVFRFHDLAIEDALQEIHHPKIEAYDGFLYLILHGIVAGAGARGFVTEDVDFFLGRNYLVTVHHAPSRSIAAGRTLCLRHHGVLAAGPFELFHRIVDQLVDHYRPEVDALEDRAEALERTIFEEPHANPLRSVLQLKRDVAALRRVVLPERDAISRLARREFAEIPDALALRFRDVYDNLVRLSDEAIMLQDRITSLLDGYLSTQSNRLNQVMKVLTVIATIFMPLTVLTGLYGMNVSLAQFPGGEPTQFWWIVGIMLTVSLGMLWIFRRMRWL
jgi:magnesium transporter